MKIITVNGATILDMGDYLIVVPSGLCPALEAREYHPEPVPCGGFERFTTRSGREAVRVLPGEGYTLAFNEDGGDRSWRDWNDRRPADSEHGDVFGWAVATSRGGGCWAEVIIVPTGGYRTAMEARYAEDLAEMGA